MKGKITIGRPHYGCGKEAISIQIEDHKSGIRFLDIELPLDGFAKALTGLSFVECEFKTRSLEFIGKTKETKEIEFQISGGFHNRKESAVMEAAIKTPKGWICSNYFNSQNSFFLRDNEDWARTSIYRYV